MGIWKIIIKIIGTRITNKINQIWKIIMKIYKTIYIFIIYLFQFSREIYYKIEND